MWRGRRWVWVLSCVRRVMLAVRCCWSGRLRSGRVGLASWVQKDNAERARVEHITAASTVEHDQGKQGLAQRISQANCKAGALPAELHPRGGDPLTCGFHPSGGSRSVARRGDRERDDLGAGCGRRATRLYERAGMRVEDRFDFWVKRLG